MLAAVLVASLLLQQLPGRNGLAGRLHPPLQSIQPCNVTVDFPPNQTPCTENSVIIGNPCINPLTAKFLEVEGQCTARQTAGQGLIKVYGFNSNTQVVITGLTAEDIKRAADFFVHMPRQDLRSSEIIVTASGSYVRLESEEMFTNKPSICAACGNGVLDAGEQCDGTASSITNCAVFGLQGTVSCTPTCQIDTSPCTQPPPASLCGNGVINAGEECDKLSFGSLRTCQDLNFGTGSLGCTSDCQLNFTPCFVCGNGVINPGEECDTNSFGALTPQCTSLGFTSGAIICTSSCRLNTSNCTTTTPPSCGNGMLDAGEFCEGPVFGAISSCTNLSFTTGSIACTPDCRLNVSGCTTCGNSLVEPGEECDTTAGSRTCQYYNFTNGRVRCINCSYQANCYNQTTPPPVTLCGNSIVEAGEQCDSSNFGGATCQSLGIPGGQINCTNQCKIVCSITSQPPPLCGNGVLNAGEECDGIAGSKTCQELGYKDGTVACADCKLSPHCYNQTVIPPPPPPPPPPPDGHRYCGDGIVQPGEQCDGSVKGVYCSQFGYLQGTLSCTKDCRLDLSGCRNATVTLQPQVEKPMALRSAWWSILVVVALAMSIAYYAYRKHQAALLQKKNIKLYVSKALAAGLRRNEVVQKLVERGWSRKDIDASISEVLKEKLKLK